MPPIPNINDGSPVHGYNLIKFLYHQESTALGSSTAGSTFVGSYFYASGTSNDALMVRIGIENTGGAINSAGNMYVKRSGTDFGTNETIGSIFIGANSNATNGIMAASKEFIVTGSLNVSFDVNVFGNSSTTNLIILNYITLESW